MSQTPQQPLRPEPSDRLEWLLAQRALEGLTPQERRELRELVETHGVPDDDALAYTAAVVQRNETEMLEMPAAVRQRIAAGAPRLVKGDADRVGNERLGATTERARPWPAGWTFALGALSAAAVIALVLNVLPLAGPTEPTPTDWVVRDWSGVVDGYEQVTGEVRWSEQQQGGQMRFRGLPANDPSQGQYQLWIVDPSRDAEPVDGGVFDVSYDQGDDGEAVIEFAAKLPVSEPTVFAVTYEKPGGVVVSEGPLLVVAAVDMSG